HWFMSMHDAQQKIDNWRLEYNTFRPHSSIDDMTPEQFEDSYEKEARISTLDLS
ncbi:MAG: transposase, partial [Cyclobacteriaceae bacterium]|nr:transposase [Cyclobacteriaceae bacterium]